MSDYINISGIGVRGTERLRLSDFELEEINDFCFVVDKDEL